MPKTSIQQYLGVPKSWRVREKIKHAIVLMPNTEDIKNADRKDPMACALHNTACRVFNVPNAAIGGRWAYIPQRDEKGNHYIARMQAPPKTQAAIKRFDRTGKMPEGGFRFMPIAESHTYRYKRRYMRLWAAAKLAERKDCAVSKGRTVKRCGRYRCCCGIRHKSRKECVLPKKMDAEARRLERAANKERKKNAA